MDSLDSKLDLFQSLKDEDTNDHEELERVSQKSVSESETHEDMKSENDDDKDDDKDQNLDEPGSSYDQDGKKKVEKQNRKEIEEEEREKML